MIGRKSTKKDPTRLLDLPAEVLCLIAASTNNDDLPNLRMTCKELLEAADEKFVEMFFSHRTHVVSQQSISALLKITKTPVLLRQMKSITINALSGAIHSPYIEWGLFEADMKKAFTNIRRNGNLIDISVVGDLSTHGYGYTALVVAEQAVTMFCMSLVFENTMTALKTSGCPFRNLSVVLGSRILPNDHHTLLTYIENNDHFLSGGRSFSYSDVETLNYSIKWDHDHGNNRMHIAPANNARPYPVGLLRDSADSIETLAASIHLRRSAVSHITLEKISIVDLQWLATSDLRTRFKSVTTLDLTDVLVAQVSGAASTLFQQLAKLPNLESCRMSGVKIVGTRSNMVYLVEVNTMLLEGRSVSDKLKQLGFALEIDLDTWAQKDAVRQFKNWKCTMEGLWRKDTDREEIQGYRLYVSSLPGAQGPENVHELW